MKKQYLGDSKDSFKWDYLDFLAKGIQCARLAVIPMATLDDKSGQGRTPADAFPASSEILNFCGCLRTAGNFEFICKLSNQTGGKYQVRLHAPIDFPKPATDSARKKYFSNIGCVQNEILFLDPDIGFEPAKTVTRKHVKYSDVRNVLGQTKSNSVVIVFQHARRLQPGQQREYPGQMFLPFPAHHREIKSRLELESVPAVFWCKEVMLVAVCNPNSEDMIQTVRDINEAYCKLPRPVQAIG